MKTKYYFAALICMGSLFLMVPMESRAMVAPRKFSIKMGADSSNLRKLFLPIMSETRSEISPGRFQVDNSWASAGGSISVNCQSEYFSQTGALESTGCSLLLEQSILENPLEYGAILRTSFGNGLWVIINDVNFCPLLRPGFRTIEELPVKTIGGQILMIPRLEIVCADTCRLSVLPDQSSEIEIMKGFNQ